MRYRMERLGIKEADDTSVTQGSDEH